MKNANDNTPEIEAAQARAQALAALEQSYEYYSDEELKLAPDYAYQELPEAA